jgi:hypothetical protein
MEVVGRKPALLLHRQELTLGSGASQVARLTQARAGEQLPQSAEREQLIGLEKRRGAVPEMPGFKLAAGQLVRHLRLAPATHVFVTRFFSRLSSLC